MRLRPKRLLFLALLLGGSLLNTMFAQTTTSGALTGVVTARTPNMHRGSGGGADFWGGTGPAQASVEV